MADELIGRLELGGDQVGRGEICLTSLSYETEGLQAQSLAGAGGRG
jgi:hypothetical protein